MVIYDNVVELAAKKNMTIMRVEREAGLANGTIGKWKTRASDPQLKSIVAVADVLGVTVNRLLRESTQ